ncbi:putative telomere length regulator protein [Diaporthe ampelina]|uniref:Putative telomere length regulator protein n=1 Tax=Diaporthe ampelina TaxID=1214573 RepID=A0A0G2HRJ2_9PEZI|nr:putative telomere length regulator protein [Diaporthe ampelina]
MHSNGDKKRGRQDFVFKENENEVPDSQPAAVAEQGHDTEMYTSELYENDVSLASEQSRSSPLREPSASQEPLTAFFAPPDQLRTEPNKQMNETSEHTDDEELVQSQLAREEKEASVEKETMALLDNVASAQLEAELVAQFEEPAEHAEQEAHEEEAVQLQPEPAEGCASKFDRLRVILQDGLGLLKSADLTREETNQLEDMFMDMKQELYQAERRGRR